MLLSYIIPVFNSSKFILKCLDSLKKQNLKEHQFEIIIVNDGSRDSSEHLIKSWQADNPEINLSYFYQENQGQGAARNFAIKRSSGKYIWFIDSDDYINENCAEKLLHDIQSNDLDALWFNHQLVDVSGNILPQPKIDVKDNYNTAIHSGEKFLTEVFNESCMPVMFIIKKQILSDYNLRFYEGIYFEDIIFTPMLIFFCKRIKYHNKVIYNYTIHENSTMRNDEKLYKRTMDSIIVVKELQEFAKNHNSLALTNYTHQLTSKILLYNYRLSLLKNNHDLSKNYFQELKKTHLYPFRIKTPFKSAILATIANISPYIFTKLSNLRPIK